MSPSDLQNLYVIGALFFGVVVGWMTYRTLRRVKTNGISDISAVIGAVGGAAVTALFPAASGAFGTYCIGLAIGFFAYLIVAGIIDFRAAKNPALAAVSQWLGGEQFSSSRNDKDQRSGGVPPLPR